MTEQQQTAEANTASPSTQTQYDAPFSVSISFPDSVVIKMVDASALNDYEIGLFVSSICFGACIGFAVAACQSAQQVGTYAAVAALFGILGAIAFFWALTKRRKMISRSRAFKLRTTGVDQIPAD